MHSMRSQVAIKKVSNSASDIGFFDEAGWKVDFPSISGSCCPMAEIFPFVLCCFCYLSVLLGFIFIR